METIEAGFDSVNKFIRPAVEQIQTAKGEQEALAALEGAGPDFELATAPGEDGALATEAAGPGPGVAGPDGAPLVGGKSDRRAPAGKKVAAKSGGWDWRRSAIAIRSVESDGSNGYDAVGPVTESGDRAYGAYQVMGANIPSWTKKHLGKAMTPQEFLKSPYAQDAVFRGEYGASVAKYGNEADAASVWFSGRPMSEAGNSSDGYNTVPEYVAKFSNAYNGTGSGGSIVDYELRAINGRSFEPRLPFTVRDAAFNASADRIISARASEAMETGLMLAQQKANGDLGILRSEMEKVRNEVMATLPKELPGLATDLDATFTRGMGAAERQTLELKQRQKIAETNSAMVTQAGTIKAEVERLALTGAGSGQISAALAAGQDALAIYGPREGFTLNGKTYGPDPSRAGIMSPGEIATGLAALTADSHRIMIEADFMKSASPGQFVEEFRKSVFSGNSPLGVGESLALLSELQGRANSAESARRTSANAERDRLEKEYKDRINPYVEMTEQGVPVAIPNEERQRILSSLSPYPDLQREAELAFKVADAAVATHGMRGEEIVAYADTIRGDIAAAAERGEIDLGAVAVLQSLEDQVKKAQDAVTAEMIGLTLLDQLAMDDVSPDQIDWDGMGEKAAGNQDVLNEIAVTEAFYRDVAAMSGMTADERDAVQAEARSRLAELVRMGKGLGADALMTLKVLDKVTDYYTKLQGLAATDATAFARAKGVALPSMEGAQSMGDVGKVLAERVALLAPLTASEGVRYPVPLEAHEIAALSEAYAGASRAEQTAFLGQIAGLGKEQADAIFGKIGQSDPMLFAAGTVYSGGNIQAAGVILRGAGDSKLVGGTPDEINAARTEVIGDLLESDMIDSGSISAIDAAAGAYARGKALSEGGRAVTQDDLAQGYKVAMGAQEDGTGGVQATRYGTTVLPAGWDADRLETSFRDLTDESLRELVGGTVQDGTGRIYTAADLRRTIEQMRVDPENPNELLPMDSEGGFFMVDQGGEKVPLIFDLGAM